MFEVHPPPPTLNPTQPPHPQHPSNPTQPNHPTNHKLVHFLMVSLFLLAMGTSLEMDRQPMGTSEPSRSCGPSRTTPGTRRKTPSAPATTGGSGRFGTLGRFGLDRSPNGRRPGRRQAPSRQTSPKFGVCLPGVSITLKKWLVITQKNGWSLTHFGWRLQVSAPNGQWLKIQELGAKRRLWTWGKPLWNSGFLSHTQMVSLSVPF